MVRMKGQNWLKCKCRVAVNKTEGIVPAVLRIAFGSVLLLFQHHALHVVEQIANQDCFLQQAVGIVEFQTLLQVLFQVSLRCICH